MSTDADTQEGQKSAEKPTPTWTPPPEQVPKVRRLSNSHVVRRLLATLIRQTWAGEIDSKTANSICYQLSIAAKVINDELTLALGKRIAALEERVAGGAPGESRRTQGLVGHA